MNNELSKNDREILFKSLGHIEAIISYTKDIDTYKQFLKNPTAMDVSLLHLGQIGELCKRFSNAFKEKYSNIDYRAISGLRNIVIHDYSGINYNEIFNTIKNDVIELEKHYKDILLNDYKVKSSELDEFLDSYLNSRKFLNEIDFNNI